MDRRQHLETYYAQVKQIILARQSVITGLLPTSTAINDHGNYTDAWVRDNVYSILAVRGLALAYQKFDDDQGRAYELEHSTIKLIRGLLTAISPVSQMRRSHPKNYNIHNSWLMLKISRSST